MAKPVKCRVNELYWRRRRGRAQWKIEGPENLIVKALIDAGYLPLKDALDKTAVEMAAGAALEEWARNNTPKD